MKGLHQITEDIVEATRRKKRKIQDEFAASVADVEEVEKVLVDAQDKVVILKGKHAEMLKHFRRGEENHFTAAEVNKSATIELNEALTSGETAGSIKNL